MNNWSDSQGVTVVVPTRNRDTFVSDLLDDLVLQDHRPLEILIVDQSDGLSPRTREKATAHPDLIFHFHAPFRNVSTARNWGWQNARYEAIMYIDDDTRCQPDLVSRHLQALTTRGASMVAGAVDEANQPSRLRRQVGRYSWWLAAAYSGFGSSLSQYVDHVLGTNFSVWRSVLRELGGYDERLAVPPSLFEETEIPIKARMRGHLIWFEAEARVMHLAANSGGNRTKDMRQYVYNLAHNRSIMIRRHSSRSQWPVGLAYTVKLTLAYAVSYRNPRILAQGGRGMIAGWRTGGFPPRCTPFTRNSNS